MNKEDLAMELFDRGYSCSQAVFAAYSEEFGLSRELALKISAPFRGGMGRLGKTCGALTGAFMVLGLKHGDVDPDDNARKDRVCVLVQELHRKFAEMHGATVCSELMGCDMSNPEARAQAVEKGLHRTLCLNLVRDAARIAGGLLEEG
jgi:C_GCAxxG_C_C family probable redox protein